MDDVSLEQQVLKMIIDKLSLEDVDVVKFDYELPIFESYADEGEGLGLDSVDALELVVGIKEVFNVKVSDEDMAIFRSVSSIADYIRDKRDAQ